MKLSPLFSDGAVFQRNQRIAVWGNATPRCIICAELNGQVAYGASAHDGNFIIYLPAMTAGGPYTLTLTNRFRADECVVVNDVRIGEVWLVSGQSNMELKFWQTTIQRDEFNATMTEPETVRMFTLQRCCSGGPESIPEAKWLPATSYNVNQFSAIATWFARKLRDRTGVTVGIINSSIGGTDIEPWISRQGLMSDSAFSKLIEARDAAFCNTDSIAKIDEVTFDIDEDQYLHKFCPADPGNRGLEQGWATPEFDDSGWKPMNIPGDWIKQGINNNGATWVRLAVDIPAHWAGKELVLSLGGVDKSDISYVNGVEIGRTGGDYDIGWWNFQRNYHVPANIVKAGKRNLIAVRGYSFAYDAGFTGEASQYILHPVGEENEAISLATQWKGMKEFDAGRITECASIYGAGYAPGHAVTPGLLFDAMIRPLIPYGIHGAIWYQGENNADTIARAQQYRPLLCKLIEDWRYQWAQGDFPFYVVQLPAFRTKRDYDDAAAWPYLREAELQSTQCEKNARLLVLIDTGEELDIHPKDKRTGGERLADLVYTSDCGGADALPNQQPPIADEMIVQGNSIRIHFQNGDGLHTTDGGKVRGFYIADSAHDFVPADAHIAGDCVVVSARVVAQPSAVRYAWADFPTVNLINAANIPASPFRME